MEVLGDAGTVTSLPCHLSPTIFHNELNLGGGERVSYWLGQFNDLYYPFIEHPAHGWLYCAFDDASGGWLYHYGLGWCWTSSVDYPFLYASDRNEWLLYIMGTEEPGWYYSYIGGSWLSF